MDPFCDPEVRHGGRCHRTMFRKQVSSPGGSGSPYSWPGRRSRSSELEEIPGHGPDPRFLCPTANLGHQERELHWCHFPQTMFRKQVSRLLDGLDPPSWPPEAEQVEQTRRKTWSRTRADPRFLCPTAA